MKTSRAFGAGREDGNGTPRRKNLEPDGEFARTNQPYHLDGCRRNPRANETDGTHDTAGVRPSLQRRTAPTFDSTSSGRRPFTQDHHLRAAVVVEPKTYNEEPHPSATRPLPAPAHAEPRAPDARLRRVLALAEGGPRPPRARRGKKFPRGLAPAAPTPSRAKPQHPGFPCGPPPWY